MADIVLTTLNAKFAHASFGLRYLMSNLGDLASQTKIAEYTIDQRPLEILEDILSHSPKIVGIGVYIWNVTPAEQLVALIKTLRPEITVVLGGPEVSYETERQSITQRADYVITGEADHAFRKLCEELLNGDHPTPKIIKAELPTADSLTLPYHLYDETDVANRVIYVEASRGCPFKCEFCLSSLDIPVRAFDLDKFLDAIQDLFDRGVRQFKFVDRTFNLNLKFSTRILQFFLDRYEPGLFVHFEMIPDRLPDALRQIIKQFPPESLQFEVGIQTFSESVAELISRRQDNAKAEENIRFLRSQTNVHIHADLIVGLPGEDLQSFAAGFDRMIQAAPHEIQVGMLKRLRGTPIIRHDETWGMTYSPNAPYEVLQTKLIDFQNMSQMRRFARFWDLVANSGNFVRTTPLIWHDAQSPFAEFYRVSEWIFQQAGRVHGISLTRLVEFLFIYLTEVRNLEPKFVATTIWADYLSGGRNDRPRILRDYLPESPKRRDTSSKTTPKRQARHNA